MDKRKYYFFTVLTLSFITQTITYKLSEISYEETFISDGKPTQQSSTFKKQTSGLPVSKGHNKRGSDGLGMYSASQCSRTLKQRNPWWSIDLGSVVTVVHVSLSSFSDQKANELSEFRIMVTNSSFDVKNGPPISKSITCSMYPWVLPKSKVSIKCLAPRTGRYLYIYRNSHVDTALSLCSVSIRTETNMVVSKAKSAKQTNTNFYHMRSTNGYFPTPFDRSSCGNRFLSTDPKFMVFLFNLYQVDSVHLYLPADCCNKFNGGLSDMIVIVSNTTNPLRAKPHSSEICGYLNFKGKKFLHFHLKCRNPIVGKYVIVKYVNNKKGFKLFRLSICQLLAIGRRHLDEKSRKRLNSNIALRKITYQSSTALYGYARFGNDGIYNNIHDLHYCTTTKKFKNSKSWWMVDLGARYEVKSIFLQNRNTLLDRLSDVDILVGDVAYSPHGLSKCKYIKKVIHHVSVDCAKPVKGRYVYIKHRRANVILTLCEAAIYGDLLPDNEQGNIVNIAYNKPVKMSSINYNCFGYRAVDGLHDKYIGNYVSLAITNNEKSPWMIVDLEAFYKVTQVVILFYDEHSDAIVHKFKIFATTNNLDSTHKLCTHEHVGLIGAKQYDCENGGVVGNQVKIIADFDHRKRRLRIAEIKIYGKLMTNNLPMTMPPRTMTTLPKGFYQIPKGRKPSSVAHVKILRRYYSTNSTSTLRSKGDPNMIRAIRKQLRPYIVVMAKNTYKVTHVYLSILKGRFYDFYILVKSEDASPEITNESICSYEEGHIKESTYIKCDQAIIGQYIYIVSIRDDKQHQIFIKDIQVFGKIKNDLRNITYSVLPVLKGVNASSNAKYSATNINNNFFWKQLSGSNIVTKGITTKLQKTPWMTFKIDKNDWISGVVIFTFSSRRDFFLRDFSVFVSDSPLDFNQPPSKLNGFMCDHYPNTLLENIVNVKCKTNLFGRLVSIVNYGYQHHQVGMVINAIEVHKYALNRQYDKVPDKIPIAKASTLRPTPPTAQTTSLKPTTTKPQVVRRGYVKCEGSFNICKHNGFCQVKLKNGKFRRNTVICKCKPGFKGNRCQKVVFPFKPEYKVFYDNTDKISELIECPSKTCTSIGRRSKSCKSNSCSAFKQCTNIGKLPEELDCKSINEKMVYDSRHRKCVFSSTTCIDKQRKRICVDRVDGLVRGVYPSCKGLQYYVQVFDQFGARKRNGKSYPIHRTSACLGGTIYSGNIEFPCVDNITLNRNNLMKFNLNMQIPSVSGRAKIIKIIKPKKGSRRKPCRLACVRGECEHTSNGQKCRCHLPYAGKLCDQDFTCLSRGYKSTKCRNNGLCVSTAKDGQYSPANSICLCHRHFFGEICEKNPSMKGRYSPRIFTGDLLECPPKPCKVLGNWSPSCKFTACNRYKSCEKIGDMPVEKRCSSGVFDAKLKTCLRNSLTCVNVEYDTICLLARKRLDIASLAKGRYPSCNSIHAYIDVPDTTSYRKGLKISDLKVKMCPHPKVYTGQKNPCALSKKDPLYYRHRNYNLEIRHGRPLPTPPRGYRPDVTSPLVYDPFATTSTRIPDTTTKSTTVRLEPTTTHVMGLNEIMPFGVGHNTKNMSLLPGQTVFFKFTRSMYLNNINPSWTFTAEKCDNPMYGCQLSFVLRDVDVEKGSEEHSQLDNGITRCFKDKIIYSEISKSRMDVMKVKRYYCGQFKMAEDSVPSNRMRISFFTDYDNTYGGFTLEVSAKSK